LIVALAIVGLLVLAGGAFAFVATSGDGRADLDQAELRGALLTEEEVGGDFSRDDDADDDDDDDFDPDDFDASDDCTDLLEESDSGQVGFFELEGGDPELGPTASRGFNDDDAGASLGHVVGTDVGDPIGLFRELAERCARIRVADEEGRGTIRIRTSEGPSAGDESFTVEVEIDLSEPLTFEFVSLITIWERDGIVSSITIASGVDTEAMDSSREVLERAVREADEKLERIIDEDG
jgi:hypothetical protein